jgi:spoIIIJ-associated protein
VDIAHYRRMSDDRMLEGIKTLAERVRATGKPLRTEPLNSYHRRLVHSSYKDDADIETWSPPERMRLKQVSLRRRR